MRARPHIRLLSTKFETASLPEQGNSGRDTYTPPDNLMTDGASDSSRKDLATTPDDAIVTALGLKGVAN